MNTTNRFHGMDAADSTDFFSPPPPRGIFSARSVILLALVLVLGLVSCGPGANGGDPDGYLGATLTITNAQVYDNTGGEADFDATLDKINGSNLADLVNPGSGSISAGKFSASLGTPKNLGPMGKPPEGVTISNPDVQFFSIVNWGATSGTKGVISMFHESSIARVDYWYVDTDVTITGADSYTYNLTLKAGWNTVITEGTTIKNGVPPAECKWVTR